MKTKKLLRFFSLLGVTGLALGALTVSAHAEETEPPVIAEEDEVKVIVQPESQVYNYPDPVSFHVEVNHPERIVSYKWVMTDTINYFELNGSSAATDTLVLPSTDYSNAEFYYWCVMEDDEGNLIYSDEAELTCGNPGETMPLLYVADYVVKPGESIDLAEKDLGSGIITYEEDGYSITLDNVKMHNRTQAVYDDTHRPAFNLLLIDRSQCSEEYHFNCIGDCVIENTYYNPGDNSGGVTLNSYFSVDRLGTTPTVVIGGEGTLKLTGGLRTVFSDGNLVIDTDVTVETPERYLCNEAFYVNDFILNENCTLTMDTSGGGISVNGDLTICDGAAVNFHSNPVYVPGAPASFIAIGTESKLTIGKADINIAVETLADDFIPYDSMLGGFTAIWSPGGLDLNGSRVNIELSAQDADVPYAMNMNGLVAPWDSRLNIRGNSEVNISITGHSLFAARGLSSGTDITVEDSKLTIVTDTLEQSLGIFSDAWVNLINTDAEIISNGGEGSDEYTQYHGIRAYGIKADLAKCTNRIHIKAEKGLPIMGGGEGTLEDELEYTPGYTPERIILSDTTVIADPQGGEVNITKYPIPREASVEAIYDASEKPQAVTEITLSGSHVYGEPVYEWADDNSAVTAARVCENDPSHTETETVKTTSVITKEAAVNVEGEKVFTAEFENPAFAKQTKTVKIPALPEIKYTVTEGSGSTWIKASGKTLTFTVKRNVEDETTYSHFKGIQIDGKDVAKSGYSAKSGSVVITLKSATLQKLNVGTHKLTVLFDDGSTEASFTVAAKGNSGKKASPDTSDANNIPLWSSLILVSCITLAGVFIIRRKLS